jgi:hypothetical protein
MHGIFRNPLPGPVHKHSAAFVWLGMGGGGVGLDHVADVLFRELSSPSFSFRRKENLTFLSLSFPIIQQDSPKNWTSQETRELDRVPQDPK